MTKRKQFREWMQEEDEWGDREDRSKDFKRKDAKRYDRKKAKIQNARKQKAKQRNSYFD